MDLVQAISSLDSTKILIAIGGAVFGGLVTLLGIWVRHRFTMKGSEHANLHAQKVLLYPQLLGLVDKTIASLEAPLIKENDMKDADIDRITENLKAFTFLPNVMLISDTKLARLLSRFTTLSGALYTAFSLHNSFIKKGLTEGIRYQPSEWQMTELKEVRKKMFNLIRKEMGAKAVNIM